MTRFAKGYRRRHNASKYKSGLEEEAVLFLKTRQKKVRYEKLKIEWEDLRYRTYTPDFELDNGIIIETKGKFDPDDRRKIKAVKQQHPDLDLRMVFQSPFNTISKKSKTTYAKWCDKQGIPWTSFTNIPLDWLI